MPAPKLTLKLIGSQKDRGDVELGDFRVFCQSVSRCLRCVEDHVAPGKRLRYRIVDLRAGSATMTIEPIPPKVGADPGPEIIALFSNTVATLQKGKAIDPRFSNADLMVFRGLAEPMNRRAKRIEVGRVKLTTKYIENIDHILGLSIPSEGSVKGRLERLNLHNRFEFVIYPPVSGYSVTCEFEEALFPRVYEAIKKNVTVCGQLKYRPGRPFPDRAKAHALEIHPPDDELPKLADLRGKWKGCTNGLSSHQFLESIRDD